jgi:choline dehydrogenase-like flavoprotein
MTTFPKPNFKPYFSFTALGHCINSLREFIMCKADMTPIRLVPPEEAEVPKAIPDFRTTHVCRDYNKLLEWARTERSANTQDSVEIGRKIRAKANRA